MSCREVKREFVVHNASPILFADAFPQGIQNAVINKTATRSKQAELANEQVEAIFKHTEVIKRIKLVLLSGQDSYLFNEFRSLIADRFGQLNIQVKSVPFFYPTNLPKIHNNLSEDDIALIKSIYDSYLEEIDAIPVLSQEQIGKYEMDAPDAEEGITCFNSEFAPPL